MPNWAESNHFFYSKNRNLVQDFLVKLHVWTNRESLYPDAWAGDPTWLGNILGHAGFPKNEIYEDKHGRCRGEITYLDNNVHYNDKEKYYYFNLCTDTAWVAMPVMWKNIINKLYPNSDLNFCYFCNEPGCDVADIYNKEVYLKLIGEEYIPNDKCYYLTSHYFEIFLEDLENNSDPKWIEELANSCEDEDFYSSTNKFINLIKDIPIDEPNLESALKDEKSYEKLNKKIIDKLREYDDNISFNFVIVREVTNLDEEN